MSPSAAASSDASPAVLQDRCQVFGDRLVTIQVLGEIELGQIGDTDYFAHGSFRFSIKKTVIAPTTPARHANS